MDIKLGAIVLDAKDSEQLSEFYAQLLGWVKTRYDEEWIIVASADGSGTPLVFQQVDDYVPPVWPAVPGHQQQQIHLDIYVDSVADGVAHALRCGATLAHEQFDDAWRVMHDPAGHPFCVLPNKPPEA